MGVGVGLGDGSSVGDGGVGGGSSVGDGGEGEMREGRSMTEDEGVVVNFVMSCCMGLLRGR